MIKSICRYYFKTIGKNDLLKCFTIIESKRFYYFDMVPNEHFIIIILKVA